MTHDVPSEDLEILAVAGLRLLGRGGASAELAERFSRVRVPREPGDAAALLAHLARMGLVRVAATTQGDPTYVPTLLGRQYADALPGSGRSMSAGLEDLEQLRTDFMSVITHELRTPLTAARTSIGLLLDPAVTPDSVVRVQLLENIARSVDRMQRLVTDLLDLARFRAGQMRLQAQRFDARSLTRDAGSTIAPLTEVRDQVLDLSVPAEPVWVYADRGRLAQVLLNLLSNATKFSPDGARIGFSLGADGEQATWVVADNGPGIAPEDQAHLFERFFTREAGARGRNAGAGLGLPIALATVQAHGGTIAVDSVVGRGSTFTVSIPRRLMVGIGSE